MAQRARSLSRANPSTDVDLALVNVTVTDPYDRLVTGLKPDMRKPVRIAQQVPGHSSPLTTLAFYTQSVENSHRSAVSSLEEIMFPNLGRVPANSLKRLAGRPGLEPG